MIKLPQKTKIIATIGPASNSLETMRAMVEAGMSVARLNFSHGDYADHAKTIQMLRQVSQELDTPVTILQDLQGPKIRVGHLPEKEMVLTAGTQVKLLPIDQYQGEPNTIPIDYPYLAEESQKGTQVLLDDGLLELKIESVVGPAVICQVVAGGILKSRKGVNLPSLNLRLPSMTEKDQADLKFGLSQGIDWVSLSFVRKVEDIRALKHFLKEHNAEDVPVIAKIEKPQAVANLISIVTESNGIMVARGDLGVEISPEKVPMLQKQIIGLCNLKNIPVITATQMLESMIREPVPTRAEASDVANAIADGTDAIMLSGESAVGKYPVKAIEIMSRIAKEVERDLNYTNYPPETLDETHAITEALNTIDKILKLRCIVAFTSTGYTAILASQERPRSLVVALTTQLKVYHRLNLIWGIKPVLLDGNVTSFENLIGRVEEILQEKDLATIGDQILIIGSIPLQRPHGTNVLKVHTIGKK
jgi:pyruvate kinase